MKIKDAMFVSVLAGVIAGIIAALFKIFIPDFSWEWVAGVSIGTFCGNFFVRIFLMRS